MDEPQGTLEDGLEKDAKLPKDEPAPSKKFMIYDDKQTLFIYGVPKELAYEFINFANAEFGGKQFIALKELIRTWRESRHVAYMLADIEALKEEVARARQDIEALRSRNDKRKDEEPSIATMGGGLPGG